MNHPDVVPYARFLDLTQEETTTIEEHLQTCGECRDLLLFVRKTNATLQREGRIAKIADALRITVTELKRHMKQGTTVGWLVEKATGGSPKGANEVRPPEAGPSMGPSLRPLHDLESKE